MNVKEFYDFAIKLDSKIISRDDVVEHMRALHYAERTIANHLTPSRHGGVINVLLAAGAIEKHGPRQWVITDMGKMAESAKYRHKKKNTPMFSGNEPHGDGWRKASRLDDGDDEGVEWILYARRFGKGCYNLKVVAVGKRVPNKANYWLIIKDGKLKMNAAATLLKQHRQRIFDNLCEDIREMVDE